MHFNFVVLLNTRTSRKLKVESIEIMLRVVGGNEIMDSSLVIINMRIASEGLFKKKKVCLILPTLVSLASTTTPHVYLYVMYCDKTTQEGY